MSLSKYLPGKQPDEEEIDERQLEIQNRMKNLLWTVSGDYTLDVKLDLDSFKKSKYISMYDAIKQGAFAKYFNTDELSLYMVKKIYMTAEKAPLMEISQLCVEAAIYPRISSVRLGVEEIRRRAFADILKYQMARLGQSFFGQVKIVMMNRILRDGEYAATPRIDMVIDEIHALETAETTMDIIRTVDFIYNTIIDRTFERRCGTLQDVLDVTMEDLVEFSWQDFLDEQMLEDALKQYLNDLAAGITQMDMKEKPKKERKEEDSDQPKVRIVTEEDLKKVYSFVELSHGKTYLSPLDHERVNYNICRGAHADCTLYYTEGILHSSKLINSQYKYAQLRLSRNKEYYHKNHRIIKSNIRELTEILRKALIMHNEDDICKADHGQLIPSRLWKLGRTDDTSLFDKVIKKDNSEFVVDILLDASGSQTKRQPQVACQGYIISEALSNIGIPHRVMGFCTFWDYTIMHRYRDYDDDRSMNSRIFEYSASSNNRDGLAIKATYDQLMQRQEDNKILIILSDGRPNDVVLNRPNSRNPRPYEGEYGIRDTAFEVRRARAFDIAVLGVFAGNDEDLTAEKRIFGKDFAYIRQIGNFSKIVGAYLRRQLEQE